ncbi:radical SAM protein [Candidatus Woesearchaeota archaeon]|nr:radical SAM protein [Candidatus Woesearchaeota archaeon]
MDEEFNMLIEQASEVYQKNFPMETAFKRAIFISWYCAVGDCDFCFMSTQKHKIADPKMAKRSLQSILAEAYLCKKLGWKIDFLSAGYGVYNTNELLEICKRVSEVYGEKVWLNVGVLGRGQMEELRPYVKGITGAIETVNRDLHKVVCPSKPIGPYLQMFNDAKGFEKSITIIIGLGETFDDLEELFNMIESNKISRINFYALNPVSGTRYSKGPSSEYYAKWIASTRIRFPQIEIVAGTWVDRVGEVSLEFAKVIEEEAKNAGRVFKGTLTNMSYVQDVKDALDEFKPKVLEYISTMTKKKGSVGDISD